MWVLIRPDNIDGTEGDAGHDSFSEEDSDGEVDTSTFDSEEYCRFFCGAKLAVHGRRLRRIGSQSDWTDVDEWKSNAWRFVVGKPLHAIRRWQVHLRRFDASAADALGVYISGPEQVGLPQLVIWSAAAQPNVAIVGMVSSEHGPSPIPDFWSNDVCVSGSSMRIAVHEIVCVSPWPLSVLLETSIHDSSERMVVELYRYAGNTKHALGQRVVAYDTLGHEFNVAPFLRLYGRGEANLGFCPV